ncbi:NAD(P)H-dependent oxidoreductase [Mesorhizobium sp. M0118]|uniref:NAD(P)H-dependent oxidoreductase n=1 Tax=Mesorhizobium sp. M0118 TaxID=2956884 RepID=UPI0004079B8A
MARISVLGISGGVSTPSRTTAVVSALVKAVASRVPSDAGLIEITEAAPSIFAGLSRRALGASGEAIIQRVEKADLLVVGTPVYRASYTGALKHLFDLVDHRALTGKTVLLAATAEVHTMAWFSNISSGHCSVFSGPSRSRPASTARPTISSMPRSSARRLSSASHGPLPKRFPCLIPVMQTLPSPRASVEANQKGKRTK